MGKRYKKAPVLEVLCEFRFKPGSSWDLTVPGLVYERIRDLFPKKREVKLSSFLIPESGGIPQVVSQNAVEFFREDGKVLVRLAENYLRVSHLRPYSSWQDFFPLIEKTFVSYREVADTLHLERLGLRYINRIEIPGKEIRLEEYFNVRPYFGVDALQTCIAFIAGGVFLFDEGRDRMKIQLTDTGSEVPGVSAFILDLDYFLAVPERVSLEDVLGWIGQAHTRIGQVFEGCITEKLRVLFEEGDES